MLEGRGNLRASALKALGKDNKQTRKAPHTHATHKSPGKLRGGKGQEWTFWRWKAALRK